MDASDRSRMLLNVEAEALAARILLDELRCGRVEAALELLEQKVDVSVCAIERMASDAQPQERERAADTLKVLSDYRHRHPRDTEGMLNRGDKLLDRARQEAERVLKKARQ